MKPIHALSTQRAAYVIIGAAGLVLMAAACGGNPPHGGASSSSHLVAFSSCMRAHGVPNFPDPGSNGTIPKVTPEQLGVSSAQFQTAQNACAYLLQPTQAEQSQIMSGMLDFARCMRSHGVPNWPDPTTDSEFGPVFVIPGIDPMSPQVSNAADACSHLLHQSTNGHPTTVEVCDGIGEDGRCHGYGNPNS